MTITQRRFSGILFACTLLFFIAFSPATRAADGEQPWITFEGKDGPGKGKTIVFLAGANEYNPEVGLPTMARILAERHGFKCIVLFTTNKAGAIDPNCTDNIPGLEALDTADLMFILCRFRALPDDQMKHIADYLESGRPVMGLRTATHSFKGIKSPTYKKYNHDSKDPAFDGGFGRQVLGETWIKHNGPNATTGTRGVFAPGASSDPILRGIEDGEIHGITGVYGVRLPLLENCKTLLLGQVISKPDGKVVEGKLNNPMMPVAWTRTYSLVPGKTGRVFTTTMGSAADIQNEPFRRMLVNAAYWTVGLEDKIPEKSDVQIVGEPIVFKPGIKASELVK